MSVYRRGQENNDDMRFGDDEEVQEQEWNGYAGYQGNYRNSNFSQDAKTILDSRKQYAEEADSRDLGRKVISAISNVSAVSQDGYKNRYLLALKELNNVLEANKKVKMQNEQIRKQLDQINRLRDDPKNSLIQSQLDQLRNINQRLQEKISQVLQMNKQYQEELNNERDNLRKEFDKTRQLLWKVEEKQQQVNSLKEGNIRQIQNLNNTINQLENANTAFKNQQFNLKQMYGGKQEASYKKINYLQTELQQAKAQLTRQRQKTNNQIQGVSIRIRKQTQTQLTAYKLQMTKLKDANIEYQRQIQKINKQLRQVTDKRAQKKNNDQRQISELQQNVENCKKQIRRLKQTLTNTYSIQIQKQSLQKQVKILQNNLHALTQDCAQSKAKTVSLQSINDELVNSNNRLEADVKKTKSQIQKLESELKRKDALINRQKNQSDSLKTRVVKLQLDHQKNQGVGNRGNIDDMQDRIRQLKNKINLLGVGQNIFDQNKQEMEKQKIEAINNMTLALEQKMEAVTSENTELAKRLQHYKQKCVALQKKADHSNSQMKILATKVQKYQIFVPKLQNQLQKAIKQSQYIQSNVTSQYLNPSQNLLKQKLKQMNDRLILQSKYAKQQLETKCLQYDSKLVSAKLQINKLKQALKGESFFHNRITQLSQKLSDSQNKKLQLMIKVGQLERYKILAERLPNSNMSNSTNINKDHSIKTLVHSVSINKQLQDLKETLILKDRQITKLKGSQGSIYGGYYNEHQRRENQVELEVQQLNQKVRQLINQNNILVRSKQQVQSKNYQLQRLVVNLQQQTHHSQANTSNYHVPQSNDTSYDQIQKLRQQNALLKEFERSYFQLEQKSSIIIKTFEQVKVKYEEAIQDNVRLQAQNQAYKRRQKEHQAQIDGIQQMFDIIHKRLQESLYKNTELITQLNQLKGINTSTVTFQEPQNIGSVNYGKMNSQEELRNIHIQPQQHYDSSPEIDLNIKNQTDKKSLYKKQFENAFFGSKKDSDASYEYETDFRGDGGFGEYY